MRRGKKWTGCSCPEAEMLTRTATGSFFQLSFPELTDMVTQSPWARPSRVSKDCFFDLFMSTSLQLFLCLAKQGSLGLS